MQGAPSYSSCETAYLTTFLHQIHCTVLHLDDADRRVIAHASDIRDALKAEYNFAEQRRRDMLVAADELEQYMSSLQAEIRNIEFHTTQFQRSIRGVAVNIKPKASVIQPGRFILFWQIYNTLNQILQAQVPALKEASILLRMQSSATQ